MVFFLFSPNNKQLETLTWLEIWIKTRDAFPLYVDPSQINLGSQKSVAFVNAVNVSSMSNGRVLNSNYTAPPCLLTVSI